MSIAAARLARCWVAWAGRRSNRGSQFFRALLIADAAEAGLVKLRTILDAGSRIPAMKIETGSMVIPP